MRHKGRLIIIEGIDGTGKTTLAKALQERLARNGFDSILTFEPTDGPWGKRLRKSFSYSKRLPVQEELDLFIKDRREHVAGLILPALGSGKIIVCDRYYFSTMAYQGARGLDPDKIRHENEAFAPLPDLMFILELDPAVALRRICEKRGNQPNNFEEIDYLKRVAAIFKGLSDPFIERLNAGRPQDEIIAAAWVKTASCLGAP
ncbi:MAG: dTMP kinase [Dissulfurimicrobium sp.]|uniref:dTMP kinase n=1 Tax=Dissulfurimicrobium hydrothermale TaxID=1750598 RepID=UPI003C75597A